MEEYGESARTTGSDLSGLLEQVRLSTAVDGVINEVV